MLNSAQNNVVLIDIDDNCCHTTAKFRKYVGDETQLGTPVVFDPSGKPLSFQSAAQKAMLDWLKSSANLVPVTGRSRQKYLQVNLGFSGYAIVSFGALILQPDGTPEPGWFAIIAEAAAAQKDNIQAVFAGTKAAAAGISEHLDVTIISDEGLDLLIKVQHKQGNNEELAALAAPLAALLPAGWTLHNNEGQLAAYPPFLGKEGACTYFLENLAGKVDLVIGSGDSLTDVGFMGLCHVMLAPTQSQIFKTLLRNEQH